MTDKVTEEELTALECTSMHCRRIYDSRTHAGKPCPVCGHPLIDAPEWEEDDD